MSNLSFWKKKKKKKTLFTGSSLKTAPQSRSGKEVVQLDHLNTLNSSFIFSSSSFWTERKNSGWDARENPAWFRWKKKLRAKGKRRRKTLRWAIAYSVGVSPETLWDVVVVVVVCVCLYAGRNACESLSLNLWLSRGAFREWRYVYR